MLRFRVFPCAGKRQNDGPLCNALDGPKVEQMDLTVAARDLMDQRIDSITIVVVVVDVPKCNSINFPAYRSAKSGLICKVMRVGYASPKCISVVTYIN